MIIDLVGELLFVSWSIYGNTMYYQGHHSIICEADNKYSSFTQIWNTSGILFMTIVIGYFYMLKWCCFGSIGICLLCTEVASRRDNIDGRRPSIALVNNRSIVNNLMKSTYK